MSNGLERRSIPFKLLNSIPKWLLSVLMTKPVRLSELSMISRLLDFITNNTKSIVEQLVKLSLLNRLKFFKDANPCLIFLFKRTACSKQID